jgi:hypothetical protein
MFTKQALERYKQATEMQLQGLELLRQAGELLQACGAPQAAELVVGDPQPAVTVPPKSEEVVLMLPKEAHEEVLMTLDKVAKELAGSTDEAHLRLASELDEIAAGIQKNAFVYEKDNIDPEQEVKTFFEKGNQVHEGAAELPKPGMFTTDVSHEVADFRKNPAPYQKL